ncbi:MAG: ABC transporter ATP-binding protein [Streptomycetaceae bacterium]|jgi:ABC-type multidrug transport system fused ATPase/permease subunit|nr:MAG: ABC transporter ATP-binding protein [Streptomycetaceae bacterium]
MHSTPFDHLPLKNPGKPELTSVANFLFWIIRGQKRVLATGTFFGVSNLLSLAILPGVLGHGIQAIADDDQKSLRKWVLVTLLVGGTQAFTGIMRHRRAISNWMSCATRLQQLISDKAISLGADLPRLVSTGEVSAINSNDVERVSGAFDLIPRLIGAFVSFFFVAILLIKSSPTLGIMVIIGVPLMSLLIAPIIKPLQSRESIQREKLSRSSNLASDTVAGLRILRGIGGEASFLARFRIASQEVRAAAVRTAKMRSLLEGMQIILPGALIVGVIWAGGSLVARGDLKVGELLAFYGYSSFLMVPLQIMTESAQRITSAVVAARRVIRLLSVENLHTWGNAQAPNISGELKDSISGISIAAGEFVGIVCDDALTADDICDRLGGYLDAEQVFIANASLQSFTRESIRSAIFSQEKEPAILSGTINSHFDVPATKRLSIDESLTAASAMDILDSLDGDGYSAEVVERGRTLSGGQRQRLSLARSLYVDAPILILDDPTSAVDAHTEARIAARLREVRNHQTTIIFTTSPLILDHTDRVILLINGHVKNTGTHQNLLTADNTYRDLVVRGE